MKDTLFFSKDSLYYLLIVLLIVLAITAIVVCDVKAMSAFYTSPSVEDLWNISPDEEKINLVCRYLVENGWVSNDVDEETFHYEVSAIMQETSQFSRVTSEFALSVAAHESNFKTDAVSPSGARGIFQLSPGYHAERLTQYMEADEKYTADRFYDPLLNIMTGMDYLDYILGEVDGDKVATVMWYNEGPIVGMSRYEKGIVSGYAESVCKLSDTIGGILND